MIHRSFLLPSCKVDLSRYHPRACLQYYIHRCLGPCVEELTTPEPISKLSATRSSFSKAGTPNSSARSPRA